MKFEGGCGRWLGEWEVGLGELSSRGIFKRAYGVGDEVGTSGERGMSIVLVRGGWRLGVSALCVGGGR
ncbi:hypothetical protein [Bartonella schoenbuchensis]|uniref:hypothetical protein n=1 Tax=Bartonella schoenbuchensis TaxID=165694 RepID=UPI0031450E80